MRKTILLLLVAALGFGVANADMREELKKNPNLSACNYQAYPDKNLPKLTATPKGYEPFYFSHYGRHGSRWLIAPSDYTMPVESLEKADRDGKLTERGKQLLGILRQVKAASTKRLGELSDVGAEQHQGIAARMYKNFPEIFKQEINVDAKSTVIIRCILSMQNGVSELKALNPKLHITTDASEHDMYYMNYSDPVVPVIRNSVTPMYNEFKKKHIDPTNFITRLFTDSKWATDSLDCTKLMNTMFDVASNMQSHHAFDGIRFLDLFTDDEIYEQWNRVNTFWYLWSGESPLTNCRMDYNQVNLLTNIINTADSAINIGAKCATLRYGHESVVLPLVCLMGLNGADYHTDDLETLPDHWRCNEIFPMACNVQFIFYRKKGAKVDHDPLVKILLNEHEATLPIEAENGPYYKWTKVRTYFKDKIAKKPSDEVAKK